MNQLHKLHYPASSNEHSQDREGLKLDNPDQLSVTAEDINILYERKNTIKNNS